MDTPKELWKMITGNMALIQVRTGKGNIYSWGKPNFGSVGGLSAWVLLFSVNVLCLMGRQVTPLCPTATLALQVGLGVSMLDSNP